MKEGKYAKQNKQANPEDAPQTRSKLSGTARGILFMGSALVLFIGAIIAALALISASAEPLILPVRAAGTSIKYDVINSPPPAEIDAPIELKAPAGVNNSTLLNILLIGLDSDTKLTDTLVLMSVNTVTSEISFLSIPRDTFISGNYDIPKINRIYADKTSHERGIQALREAVDAMVGFATDYYFVIDEQALTLALSFSSGVTFDVPSSASYSGLPSGTRTFTDAAAMQLLCYGENYDRVETDSTQVQRAFLQALFQSMLADTEGIIDNATALVAAADTNLTANELAYLGYLLKNVTFSAAFSTVLPGEVLEAGELTFFEVDPEDTLGMLNSNFNPSAKALEVFDLHFRQLTGSSTDGEMSPYGFTTRPTTGSSDDDDDDEPTEPTEPPTGTDSTDKPDSTDEPTEPDSSDAPTTPDNPEPTEPSSTDAPEPPSEP